MVTYKTILIVIKIKLSQYPCTMPKLYSNALKSIIKWYIMSLKITFRHWYSHIYVKNVLSQSKYLILDTRGNIFSGGFERIRYGVLLSLFCQYKINFG